MVYMGYTVCIVQCSTVYGICIIHNSIYQYVRLYDDVWLNEARHIWHIDRVIDQWQNLKQISIWFSASVPDHKAICYLLLSVAISCYPVSVRFLCVCYLLSGGVAFYCVAVKVLYCFCDDFCFLVLCCLLLCLVILLYYSNCIIIFRTAWYLLYIIICNTIQYRKNKAKRIMCVILLAFLY